MPEVELRRVMRRFAAAQSPALQEIDLTVRAGEILAVVGPSGSGKTTLLRLIAGLDAPTAGEILIGGQAVTRWAPDRRNVSLVFQHPVLVPHLDVRGNLLLSRELRGKPLAGELSPAGPSLEEVAAAWGLERLLDRRPEMLSGGEQQRVAIGRALLRGAAVCLWDEPLSALDAPTREQLRLALRAWQKARPTTSVYVTHDQREALGLADRLAVLDGGRLLQVGRPEELYHCPADLAVARFVGAGGLNVWEGEIALHAGGVEFLHSGGRLPIDKPWSEGLQQYVHRRLVLGIRPEQFRLRRAGEGAGPDSWWGRIEQRDWLGPWQQAQVRLTRPWSGQCSVWGSSELDWRAGEDVALEWSGGRALWFDPATGRRMERAA